VGSKHKRKESISARLALLKPEDESLVRRELGEERGVQDEKRGERVAMLRLHAEALPNSKIRRSFDRQLKALEGFTHPNVVEVLEGGTNDGEGRGFLISRHVEGRTLREVLADAPLPPQDAIGIAMDLLNALAVGHWRWLVHGGISPESILIVPEEGRPRAKILHYGFAPVVGETRETCFGEARIGLDYAAPEAVKGEPVDPRADVYSVGLLLFEMVTGRHAVPAIGSDPVRSRVLDQADALPKDSVADPDLYARLKSVLKRSLEKDPNLRFCSARSFAMALSGHPLPSEDSFEDAWAWPEACPEGGVCAASGATIPPLSDRTWTRKQSDRPFRCRVTGKDYAGSEHWDTRGLCSRGGRHRPLPAPEGEAPEDVIYDDLLDAPDEVKDAPAPKAPAAEAAKAAPAEGAAKQEAVAKESSSDGEASPPDTEKLDRRAAILELLKDDARVAGFLEDESAKAEAVEKKPEPKPEPEPEASDDDALVLDPVLPKEERERSSSGRDLSDSTTIKVEEAFLDAWDGTKRRTEAATTRMKRASTRSVGRPEAMVAGDEPADAPRPVGRPQTSDPATVPGDPFRWQVGAAVLAVVVLMLGVQLNDEIESNKKAIATLSVAHGKKLEETQRHSGELNAKLNGRERALRALEAKQQQTTTQLATAQKAVTRQANELSLLNKTLQSTQQTLGVREKELTTSKAASAALQAKLSIATKASEALESQLASVQAERKTLEGKLSRTEVQLAAGTREVQRLEGVVRDERGKLAQAKVLVEGRDGVIRDLQATLAQSKAELAQSQRAKGALETSLAQSQRAKGALETSLAQSRAAEAARRRELSAVTQERTQAQAELAREVAARSAQAKELGVLKGQVKQLQGSLAKLTRERSDLLVELADLEAEREQLDAEGLQLERWLRESEARSRTGKAGAGEQLSKLRLRSVAANGQAKDAVKLNLPLGERGLAVVEAAALSSVLKKAQAGEVLLTLRIRCQGGPPVLKLQGFLQANRIDRPSAAGVGVKLEKVGPGEYRAWLRQEVMARYKAPTASAGFGVLLVGGSNPSQVASVELRASPLSEDARALLLRAR